MYYLIRSTFLLLLLVILTLSAYGQSIDSIKKDAPAPYDGYIIDSKMEQKMRYYKEENKKLQEVNIELKSLGELQDIRHEIYKKNAEDLTSQNNKLQTNQSTYLIIGIIVGTIVTGGISYATIKTLK